MNESTWRTNIIKPWLEQSVIETKSHKEIRLKNKEKNETQIYPITLIQKINELSNLTEISMIEKENGTFIAMDIVTKEKNKIKIYYEAFKNIKKIALYAYHFKHSAVDEIIMDEWGDDESLLTEKILFTVHDWFKNESRERLTFLFENYEETINNPLFSKIIKTD